MDIYLKELPDNTVTMITTDGQIIGKFDSLDEVEDVFLEHINDTHQEMALDIALSA